MEEIKIDGIPVQDYGTPQSKTCYSENYTVQIESIQFANQKDSKIDKFFTNLFEPVEYEADMTPEAVEYFKQLKREGKLGL